MNKMVNKLLASMLVITLTFANLILLGIYATESFATSSELEKQETLIEDTVDFDAYFLDEEGKKTHTKTIDINSQDEKLYVSIEVLQGYLRNAKIELTDANFKMQNISSNYETIQEMTDYAITLNQIASGNKNVFEIPINVDITEEINLDNFTKQSQIKITGSAIDNDAETTSIENTIIANLNLHGQASLSLNQEITKFTPYNVGSKTGLMVQTTVTSGIENYTLPIEQTDIKVQVPTLKDGTKPSKINVSANSLEATRNDIEGIEFSSDNWSYNEETGIVSIIVNNEKEYNNIVSWGKEGLDEFVITYIFENAATPTELPVHLNATLKIKAYNNEITELEKTEEKDVILQEKLGDIVTFEITSETENLAKGFLYANSNYETEYKTTWIADLGYADLIDQIQFGQTTDTFLSSDGKQYATSVGEKNYAYFKSTKIAKDNFTKILGSDENAYINIYDGLTNSIIATINSQMITEDSEYIEVNYEQETNRIFIETSKPVKEGKLEIQHTKSIKAKTDYSKEQLKTFTAVQTSLIGEISNNGLAIVSMQEVKEIQLTEPNTKIDVLVNNSKSINLSTVVKNENVEFKVILKNTDITSDLFKNPVVEIVFPSYIEKMEIRNISLLFDEELNLNMNNIETYTKQDGRIAIQIPLTGTQTVYNFNTTQNGTNLVINADITAKLLTPSTDTIIETYVTNENATSYEQEKDEKAYQEVEANFIAPVGMVTVNTVSEYNDKQETVTSLNGKEEIGQIATQAVARNAKVTLTVINNYEETCKNVSILGRIPFKGNKSLALSEDLGSTFTTKLVSGIVAESGIDASQITVYYTQNENATNELDNEANGWSADVTSLESMKSYLIVLNNYEMQKGQSLVFSYNIEIPEKLQHNESAFSMYAVIFEKDNKQDKVISPKVGISTMDGLNLETKMYNNIETGAIVQEGQIIKYTVEVTNTGKTVANNLKVTSKVPEGTTYVIYIPENTGENGEPEYGPARYVEKPEITTYETTIDTINLGETKQVSYEVKVVELNETTSKIATTATITSEEYVEDIYTTNTIENTIEKGYFNISLKANLEEGTGKIAQNDKLFYEIKLNNVNTQTKNNIQIKMNIPQELTYGATYLFDAVENIYSKNNPIAEYNEEDRKLTITIDKLEQEEIILGVGVSTNDLAENETSKQIESVVEATCDETTNVIKSNTVSYKIAKPILSITQTSDIAEGVIAENEELNYIIEITNSGEMVADSVSFLDQLPEGVTCEQIIYSDSNNTTVVESNVGTVSHLFSIETGQTMTITIKVKTNVVLDNTLEKEIKNIAQVTTAEMGTIESNAIIHTIDSTVTPPDEEGEIINSTYRISGMIWVDANEDGIKDDQEEKLESVAVALIDTQQNSIVNTCITDSFGKYKFTDLEKGKYMVAFIYDSTMYAITEYQKDGVNESRNSDAIEKTIIIENEAFVGAVTDDIVLNNTNAYNIDLGLIARNKFDLSLTKSISNITVTTTKGTQNYDYEDGTKLAKVDIAPKRIEGASVVIEYKFTIINEGNVAGYVNKIVDYLPAELKFNTNMNPDWYQAEDGEIYNASLSNDIIQPGETREITLILTKTMTGENVGIINNSAEIYEAYNELALTDINSTPANQAQDENDMGSADVLITVNTGEPAMYITITIIMLVIFAVGAYMINIKVLKKTM